MMKPNFEEMGKLTVQVISCFPTEFGDALSPKLRLRYFRLLNDMTRFYRLISKLQKKMAGAGEPLPDLPEMLSAAGKALSPDFRMCGDAFQAMCDSLPGQYLETLSPELQRDYGRALECQVGLHAAFDRLEADIQKIGLL